MKQLLDYDRLSYIGSCSFSKETDDYIISRGLNPIRIENNALYFTKLNKRYRCNDELSSYISSINELDVIGINDSGVFRHIINQNSDDATLFITEKCNSNCIMCPYSETIRRNGELPRSDQIIETAMHFPQDLKHITITGGEPFMIKDTLFQILDLFRSRYYDQEVLLLTNGRIFCNDYYVNKLADTSPRLLVLGIPLHGSNAEAHDRISQTKDSFKQTCSGISRLLKNHTNIEIRVVVNKLNYLDLDNIASFIGTHFPGIFRVVFIGLEMLGNAVINKNDVWISYRNSAEYVEKAVDKMTSYGITSRIYNYPLCVIDKRYWDVCYQSISDYKIVFSNACDKCVVKSACGGVFNSTYFFEKDELRPIEGE